MVEPIIERDVLLMTRVDKPSLLKRLFEMGAPISGQVMSYNKMRLRDFVGFGRRYRPPPYCPERR